MSRDVPGRAAGVVALGRGGGHGTGRRGRRLLGPGDGRRVPGRGDTAYLIAGAAGAARGRVVRVQAQVRVQDVLAGVLRHVELQVRAGLLGAVVGTGLQLGRAALRGEVVVVLDPGVGHRAEQGVGRIDGDRVLQSGVKQPDVSWRPVGATPRHAAELPAACLAWQPHPDCGRQGPGRVSLLTARPDFAVNAVAPSCAAQRDNRHRTQTYPRDPHTPRRAGPGVLRSGVVLQVLSSKAECHTELSEVPRSTRWRHPRPDERSGGVLVNGFPAGMDPIVSAMPGSDGKQVPTRWRTTTTTTHVLKYAYSCAAAGHPRRCAHGANLR